MKNRILTRKNCAEFLLLAAGARHRCREWLPEPIAKSAIVGLLVLVGLSLASGNVAAACEPTSDPTEICDGLDNDCNGTVDDGFFASFEQLDGKYRCVVNQSGPAGQCKTLGLAVCSADHSSVECTADPSKPIQTYQPESLASGLCGDSKDNDCDGKVDVADNECQSPEICDGVDNDGDGVIDNGFGNGPQGLGKACKAGAGACQDNGSYVCAADHNGTVCSAEAGTPAIESFAGGTCGDGIDNNCDGKVDDKDPACAITAELCNGADDNGNGVVDETFGVGQACTKGVGACAVAGTVSCLAQTTAGCVASKTANPEPESDAAGTCSDQIDNDCDGLTDGDDVGGCKSGITSLGVQCSLPYTVGKPGNDCNGKHTILFGAKQFDEKGRVITVVADLLALDKNGKVIQTVRDVKNKEEAQLASRLSPSDYKFQTRTLKGGSRTYQVFAPLPMLRVTATQGSKSEVAYCSQVPYLDVTDPDGVKEISLSEGDVVDVQVAVPLVNTRTLQVKVDGVELFPLIGVNPSSQFPGGTYCGNPSQCTFQISKQINGTATPFLIEVRDLAVKGLATPNPATAKDALGKSAQNLMSFKLKGLPAGGHIIAVNGSALPFTPVTDACLIDDIADKGQISSFGISIEKPGEQAVVSAPAEVKGEVRGGVKIARLSVNGGNLPVAGQQEIPGDGVNTADEYVLPFDVFIPPTDLSLARQGQAPLGSFQPGSNNLVADALSGGGKRTFAQRIFATGDVASPGLAALQSFAQRADTAINQSLPTLQANMATLIDNAFVVGLNEQGAAKFFNKECTNLIDQFTKDVHDKLSFQVAGSASIQPTCSCDLNNIPVRLGEVNFPGQRACNLDFVDNQMNFDIKLPDIAVSAAANASCETSFLGACIARTVVNITANWSATEGHFKFPVTEGNIKDQTPPTIPSDALSFAPPTFTPDFHNSGVECIGADICNFFVIATDFLVNVFTFGLVDNAISLGDIADIKPADFQALLENRNGGPIPVEGIKPDVSTIESFGQSAVTTNLSDVQIENGGLTMSISATFNTQNKDPSVPETPGAVLTPASAPAVGQLMTAQGGDISLLLADDDFNQFFASMAQSGALKTQCNDTGKTVGDLLPADCNSLGSALPADNVVGRATLAGLCYGARNVSTPQCEAITNTDFFYEAVLQGVCHGVRGDNCATLPTRDPLDGLAEIAACGITTPLNIGESNRLSVCGGEAIPPRLVFENNASGGVVKPDLFLNDLSVSFVLDRNADGFSGDLATTKNCFAQGGAAVPDCKLFEACLDLTLKTSMTLDSSQCPAGETGFRFAVNQVIPSGFQAGVVCAAASETDNGVITQQSAEDPTVDEIADNAQQFAPPICAQGLNLGGKLSFAQGKLFTIKTTPVTTENPFGDFIGISGNLQ